MVSQITLQPLPPPDADFSTHLPPDLVVELLSDSTARYDKTGKKALYAQQVHVPEYYWYDPFNPDDFAGFTLVGAEYQPLSPDARGRILSPTLNLCLGTWEGVYLGVEAIWLRWFTPTGELLPNKDEIAEQKASAAEQKASAARQEAALAAKRAAHLAEQLRKLGVDPEKL